MTPQLRLDVRRDWSWSDGYLPEVRRILAANALSIVRVHVASVEQDVKQATDMLLTVEGRKSVAVRLRRAVYPYRDLTIRATRTSGVVTELEKIRDGSGDIYLYGWTVGYRIPEWMLIDLERVRQAGLLAREWRLIWNPDRVTAFIAIPYTLLDEAGCVLAHEMQQGGV